MMSVTTKTGDKGTTDGPGGMRVPKNDSFITLVGALDEVNAQLGICDALVDDKVEALLAQAKLSNDAMWFQDEDAYTDRAMVIRHASSMISWTQHKLLDMGAELYTGNRKITNSDVEYLEKFIQEYESNPGGFIIPNGHVSSAIHLAKAMVRRAEREGIACKNPTNFVSVEIVRFLNRLSDALYVLALTVADKPHIMWVTNKEM